MQLGHARAILRIDHDGGGRLVDDCGSVNDHPRRETVAMIARRVELAVPGKERRAAHPRRRQRRLMRHYLAERRAVQQCGQPTPPVNAFNLLPGLFDRENPLVFEMERLDSRIEVGLVFELALGQRDVEFPNLVRVSRLDEVFAREAREAAYAQLGLEALHRCRYLAQHTVYRFVGKVAGKGEFALRELAHDVGVLAAASAERTGRTRHQHLAASEFPRDRHDVPAGRAATRDEQALAWIDALIDGDVLDRADHVIARDFHYCARGVLHTQAEPGGDFPDGGRGRIGVRAHSSRQKIFGIEIPEHQRRVGDRRFSATDAVARRTRFSTRALGANAPQSARVDPGDRAAAGADALNIDRGQARNMPGEHRAQPGLARERDLSVMHQAYVEAGAAGVAYDEVATADIVLGISAPGHRRHRGARLDQVNRTLNDIADMHHAAE